MLGIVRIEAAGGQLFIPIDFAASGADLECQMSRIRRSYGTAARLIAVGEIGSARVFREHFAHLDRDGYALRDGQDLRKALAWLQAQDLPEHRGHHTHPQDHAADGFGYHTHPFAGRPLAMAR